MPVGNALVVTLLEVFYAILDFYYWILIIGAVLSWLIAFGIVDPYNRIVRTLADMFDRITEPALRPIRRVIPPVNGMDFAPLVLIFVIYFLKLFVINLTHG